jgi:hypothetical protein
MEQNTSVESVGGKKVIRQGIEIFIQSFLHSRPFGLQLGIASVLFRDTIFCTCF